MSRISFQLYFLLIGTLIIPVVTQAQTKLRVGKNLRAKKLEAVDYDKDGLIDIIALECQQNALNVNLCNITLFPGSGGPKFLEKEIIKTRIIEPSSFLVLDLNQDDRPDILYSHYKNLWINDKSQYFHEYYWIQNSEEKMMDPKHFLSIPSIGSSTPSPLIQMDFNSDGIKDLAHLDKSQRLVKLIAQKDGSYTSKKGPYFYYEKSYRKVARFIKYKDYISRYKLRKLAVFSVQNPLSDSYKKTFVEYWIENGLNDSSGTLKISNIRRLPLPLQKKLLRNEILSADELFTLLNSVDKTPKNWNIEDIKDGGSK